MSDAAFSAPNIDANHIGKTRSEPITNLKPDNCKSAENTRFRSTLAERDGSNPPSPKRRRISPVKDDAEIDFEAAAARALAISLGVEQTNVDPTHPHVEPQRNGAAQPGLQRGSDKPLVPDQQVLLDNLPTLDNLATEILSTLAKMSHLEVGEMLFGPPSQRGQEYRSLKARFEQLKRSYLTTSPFIITSAHGTKDATHVEMLRKTNMATFMASIFSGEIGLRVMDIHFLEVFVPEGGRLLKAQASIYLELKTQAFIAAKRTAPAMLNQVMLDLFPGDVERYLLSKRPGAKSLAPSETDFVKRLSSRRDILYSDMRNKRLDGLESRYRWDDFSREVNGYLAKYYDQIDLGNKEKAEQLSPVPLQAQLQQEQMEGQFSISSNHTPQPISMPSNIGMLSDLDFDLDSFVAQAARAAEIALQGDSYSGYGPARTEDPPAMEASRSTPPLPSSALAPAKSQSMGDISGSVGPLDVVLVAQSDTSEVPIPVKTEFQQYKPVTTDTLLAANGSSSNGSQENVPHKSQTAPTQVLYERARLVTTNKVSPSSRKPNPPSHRRPWTKEEEYALMTGLDQVKGPHWSQILAMYGPGGTINESLKDRNQVQLKDKARNLKLFFLKAGIEVPYYLQAVTGDLKTRAPGQAEKREARERERTNVEEGDDAIIQQEDLRIDGGDESDGPTQSTSDQEDVLARSPVPYQEAQLPHSEDKGAVETDKENVFDMEAMIARAAASATQSLEKPWL